MTVKQVIGARYVPLFSEPIDWDNTKTYEPLTIVYYGGNSYTSKQAVPKGIDITNTDYWALTGNYNAQIEQYRSEVMAFDSRITTNETNIASNTSAINSNTAMLDGTKDSGLKDLINNAVAGTVNVSPLSSTSDNASAIQAVVNANPGKIIIIPAGSYPVASTIDISNGAQLYCIGELVAESGFTGTYMVTFNQAFDNPTVNNMVSYKNNVINVNCNNISGLNGIGCDHSYRCNFITNIRNCMATGLNSSVSGLTGDAENKYTVTVYNENSTTGTIGAIVNKPDSVFIVHTREVETGIKVNATCDIEYIHSWLATNKLWANSTTIDNSSKVNCINLVNDTMRYSVKASTNSIICIDTCNILMNTSIVSASTITTSPYRLVSGNYSYCVINCLIDTYKAVISDSDYVDGNATEISSTYQAYEFQGDLLKAPAGTFWLNGTSNTTNAPSAISSNTWCTMHVLKGHNYNFIYVIPQDGTKIYFRSSHKTDSWKAITATA